jgi:hypothetical protein
MPRITYIEKNFSSGSLVIIHQANKICEEYAAQGFDLTLRQLYYQFVSRGLIPNKDTEYKRLGSIINDARLAGMLDWKYITDRTRNLRANSHWSSPSDIINSAARSYALNKWQGQNYRPEVWIEKDALIGVIARVCEENDVPYFSCRGYTSQSEVWAAGQRLIKYFENDQIPTIIHLGDHDPSGIDMTRDITDRLALFVEHEGYDPPEVIRIALNMDQVDEYNPPPNPTKLTDSRATGYLNKFGDESWELDALEPSVIAELIQDEINKLKNTDLWDKIVQEEDQQREVLTKAASNWDDVTKYLSKKK